MTYNPVFKHHLSEILIKNNSLHKCTRPGRKNGDFMEKNYYKNLSLTIYLNSLILTYNELIFKTIFLFFLTFCAKKRTKILKPKYLIFFTNRKYFSFFFEKGIIYTFEA